MFRTSNGTAAELVGQKVGIDAMLAILERGPRPRVQTNLQPRAWLTDTVRTNIKTEPVPLCLLLPNDFPVLHLRSAMPLL